MSLSNSMMLEEYILPVHTGLFDCEGRSIKLLFSVGVQAKHSTRRDESATKRSGCTSARLLNPVRWSVSRI